MSSSTPSPFGNVPIIPADPLFLRGAQAKADTSDGKINGVLGVARCNALPHVPQTVQHVSSHVNKMMDETNNNEYLPIAGDPEYLQLSKSLITHNPGGYASIGTPGGTGALSAGFRFIRKLNEQNPDTNYKIIIPNIVWGNTLSIAAEAGISKDMLVRLDDCNDNNTRYDTSYVEGYKAAENEQPVFLFHGACKNPNGVDPLRSQWEDMAKKMQENGWLAFVDFAYQGFGTSFEEDKMAIETFEKHGVPMMVAQSFSKNFALYDHRVGNLNVTHDTPIDSVVQPILNNIARSIWSNPTRKGQMIVKAILENTEYRKDWQQEIDQIRGETVDRRGMLSEVIPGITDRKGMFDNATLGFDPNDQKQIVSELEKKYHIWTADNGRINLSGISDKQAEYLYKALKDLMGK